jgi:hypothetical protein
MTDIERHQLPLLREELRIDPPPTMEEMEGRSTSLKEGRSRDSGRHILQ